MCAWGASLLWFATTWDSEPARGHPSPQGGDPLTTSLRRRLRPRARRRRRRGLGRLRSDDEVVELRHGVGLRPEADPPRLEEQVVGPLEDGFAVERRLHRLPAERDREVVPLPEVGRVALDPGDLPAVAVLHAVE